MRSGARQAQHALRIIEYVCLALSDRDLVARQMSQEQAPVGITVIEIDFERDHRASEPTIVTACFGAAGKAATARGIRGLI